MAKKPWEGRFNKLYVCMYVCMSALLAHLLQRLVYPNMLGPRVTRRWVLGRPENTTVALCQRVVALLAFPRTVL